MLNLFLKLIAAATAAAIAEALLPDGGDRYYSTALFEA